ncbi:unnamed protein product [Mytilus coruscus]|uniref:Uncharacterized protein n=1 Tax=Mytilus coruscus TaxID=42192 RepID=A0A6J8DN18_MYTCO|nr:unnamed protein product [Mytilus coruscus]
MSESEKKARKRTPCFRIEVSGTEEKKDEIFGKFASIRQELTKKNNKPMGNLQVIEALLQKWNEKNDTSNTQTKEFQEEPCPSTYIRSKKVDTNQHIFLTAADSFKRLISVVEWHARCCKEKLKPTKLLKKGHVCKISLKCNDKETPHVFSWSSSPYLPTKDYLVNSRVNHGITCSGILPAVYKRFAQGSGIGVISDENRTSFFNVHSQHIQEEYKYSTDIALLQEIASYEELDSKIDIMSDARHGWRKNAKDTSVVCIGEKTHKVISCEHVTKTMDPVSQRHERLGTEKIFNYLHENDVTVNVHCHDRNLSINKYIRENTEAINQNDVWHCVKSVKSALKKVSTGSKSSEGKTWSFQLSDKVEPVATHMHWAIQNCNQDEKKLQKSLLNILDHYKNIHTDCHESARCKVDAKYEPSRIVITSPVAEKLLLSVILNATVYKYAKDYVLGRDTFYVESFNNVTNIYQNKRIAFGDSQYNARANLSVLHWNENVDRDFTSVSIKQNHRMPRSKKGKKNYKRATYKFRDNIWSRFMKSIYSKRNRRQ